MPELARGQASDCANPALDIFTQVNGTLTDVASLEFQIFEDVTTPGTPVQVYPIAGRQAVNITDLCPVGDKISTGRYVANWTPDLAEPIGVHKICWFFKLTATSPEQTFSEEFSVLAEVTGSTSSGYCTIADLRAKGVPETGIGAKTDAELQALIAQQSAMIDLYTGRFFEPRSMVQLLDGTGRRGMLIGQPIISISRIRLIATDFSSASELDVDLGDVRIYNRHLSGLSIPDDRENPRIEFLEYDRRHESLGRGDLHGIFHPHRWPEGTQNVEITGIFGYTEHDGSPTGRTPPAIGMACCMMVIRNLASPLDPDYFDTVNGWRVTELKTRDQTIKWASPDKLGSRGIGAFTGDPTIDNILAAYVRPPTMGAV